MLQGAARESPHETQSEALPITIVIPARDEAAMIGACLAALARQSVGAGALEVIVVVAGEDETEAVAARAGQGRFGRFEIVRLEAGYKQAALRAGCARAHGEVVVLLDADTELAPDAVEELVRALARHPRSAVHGAAQPRFDTWVSRYWETNRRLVKDLRFDGNLSGEFLALPRAALAPSSIAEILPMDVGVQGDRFLGWALRARGYEVRYLPSARAMTLVPFTLRGLVDTMQRSRRGLMGLLPPSQAALQAARSAALLAGVPAALAAARWSLWVAAACAAPLVAHVVGVGRGLAALRRRGLGDHLLALPAFVAVDLLGRALKLWAFLERLGGRPHALTFRGERPVSVPVAGESRE